MIYIQPLSEYNFNLQSKKLEGLARLVKLNIPTVSNLFVVLPQLYQEFQKTNKLSSSAVNELKVVFRSIKKQGDTVTLRNSIFEPANPGMAFSVLNTLNIKSFVEFQKRLILGYKKAARMAINPVKVEFCYLIQSFYSSEKCGTLLSDTGQNQIFLQAIFGQHTKLLLRGDIESDTYKINKRTYKIAFREVSVKKHRIKKLNSGIKKIRVKKTNQYQPVLTDKQIVRIAKQSQIAERAFGPQEMEWAILDSGQIIFQETRDFKQSKSLKFLEKAEIIFPAQAEGKILNLKKIPVKTSLSEKIIITSNLNIAFINKLAFLHRPKAIILTRGSLTSHAATILREAKMTTVLARNIAFKNNEKISIQKDGSIKKIL